MTAPPDAVAADEFILRRVHKNHCSVSLPRAVHLAAFRPSREDVTGLSVYREKHLTAAQVAASGRKAGEYFVVRIPVRLLLSLGLTVVPDDAPDSPPGHALIPELSLAAYEGNKQRLKDVLLELARAAGEAIVHHAAS
jgi:hypothetical protein